MLQANKIFKTYEKGNVQETVVLRNVCAEFEQGVFYAIIGKSGSGKTTLLNILCGLDSPDQGHVLLDGTDIYKLTRRKRAILRRRKIGFIFQSYNLLQEHTALENIFMPYILDHRKPDRIYIDKVCSMLEIDTLLNKYPMQMSGGEQQRVAIARAIVHRPKIIFADEPTGNLDPQTGRNTLALLKEIVTQFGSTLILVTHDISVAEEAQQVLKVEGGIIT